MYSGAAHGNQQRPPQIPRRAPQCPRGAHVGSGGRTGAALEPCMEPCLGLWPSGGLALGAEPPSCQGDRGGGSGATQLSVIIAANLKLNYQSLVRVVFAVDPNLPKA